MNEFELGLGAVMDDPDVFLNHRGPDVKATFVAHLADALKFAGFRPFLDAESLLKGNSAFKSIDQALATAKVHVAVISERYAESKYCLNELVAMIRSRKPVIPVFYGVEPVHLRWLEDGPFAAAFEKHKSKGRNREVQEWTDALQALAEITGFRLADYKGDEAKLKDKVVSAVAQLTPSNETVETSQYRVGLKVRAGSCIQVLKQMGADTGMLCLVGMGGIGKSTLAREIYNHFVAAKMFRYMTFLEISPPSPANVHIGLTSLRELQKQVMWDVLHVQDSHANYFSWFRKLSTRGPVFIVIDNIQNQREFKQVVPDTTLLGKGSRIIVTSRDQSILNVVAAETNRYMFNVSELESNDSDKLFNWHAFRAEEALEDFKELAKDIAKACYGLPLALEVIGSSLYDKRSDDDRNTIWPEAIDALRKSPDVMGVLKQSYDCLSESEKVMFLDITCFFYGWDAKEASKLWKSCNGCISCDGFETPNTSLRHLIDKNLVKVKLGNLITHDLLRVMGQHIGRMVGSHLVGGRARAIVANGQGRDKIRALNLAQSWNREFEAEGLAKMQNLHFLVLDKCSVSGDFVSDQLRVLSWRCMPLVLLPAKLHLFNLISLDFSDSENLASLCMESNANLAEARPNLVHLYLRSCTSITKLPDTIGQLSNLQTLDMAHCSGLQEIPSSIGQLEGLQDIDLHGCTSLESLSDSIGGLSNLRSLDLGGCTSIPKLPNTIGQLSNLRELKMEDCSGLQELPSSIGQLEGLKGIYLDGCTSLESLPDSIGGLSKLRLLNLIDCTFTKVLDTLGPLSKFRRRNMGDSFALLSYYIAQLERLQTYQTSWSYQLEILAG